MSKILLNGCAVEPLGSYLKGLAVLRLVSEQADPTARGCWDRVGFCIDSCLDKNALVDFFLKEYRPTPILAPWNGGSGFYAKDNQAGIEAIANSADHRFALYREAIQLARAIPEVALLKGVAKADEDERRFAILRACRNLLPDACVDWLDAAVGVSAEGKRAFAPILGTGGNEGRLDYTNNFMEYLANLLIAPETSVRDLLLNALFGDATGGLEPGSVGQYDPGRAGGFNQGQGVETADTPSNPWNFVLTLEGAVAWAAGLYRRQGVAYRSFLCSPFTVAPAPVGYGSAAAKDKALARAEIWTPVWDRPATYAEIRVLLREGRATVDGKPARNGLEFAQAACMLGVDRGICGFVRYSLLKRRGDSYIALPAGRFNVRRRVEADLVRELTPLLEDSDRQMGDGSATYVSLRRQIDEAIYSLLLRGDSDGVNALRDVAVSVGRLCRWALTTGRPLRFFKRLSQDWVSKLDRLSEARIAAAIASIWHPDVGSFRDQLESNHSRFAWSGPTLAARMGRALERRILLGEALSAKHNPLGSAYRASIGDVGLFLEESSDDELIEDLLFAFTLVNWQGAPTPAPQSEDELDVWPIYALLKHLFLPGSVSADGEEIFVTGDLSVLSALSADRISDAARIAIRRLENAGVLPLEADYEGGFRGERLAAALLIPVPYGAALRRPVLQRAMASTV